MTTISQTKMQELYRNWEKTKVDFKLKYELRNRANGPKAKAELAKDVCALANVVYQNMGKGYLIIGIDNRRNVVGIDPVHYQETELQQTVSARSNPPPVFDVEYVPFRGVILACIIVTRSSSGPHQLTSRTPSCAGFPIRRGSTTEMMSTDEVYQTMLVRNRISSRQPSEYQNLAPDECEVRLMDDCEAALNTYSTPRQNVERIEYPGETGHFRIFPLTLLKLTKTINRKPWDIYASIRKDNARKVDLGIYNGSTNGFSGTVRPYRSIFIHFVHGSIAPSFVTDLCRTWGVYINIGIPPKITYFGMGRGAAQQNYREIYVSKFLVSHIKSLNDITFRLETIFNWVSGNEQMFNDIRNALTP